MWSYTVLFFESAVIFIGILISFNSQEKQLTWLAVTTNVPKNKGDNLLIFMIITRQFHRHPVPC